MVKTCPVPKKTRLESQTPTLNVESGLREVSGSKLSDGGHFVSVCSKLLQCIFEI